jgi:FtsZ-interacting cell division protein ZipA
MVEVDPMLLIAGGTTIAALVGALACCSGGKKENSSKSPASGASSNKKPKKNEEPEKTVQPPAKTTTKPKAVETSSSTTAQVAPQSVPAPQPSSTGVEKNKKQKEVPEQKKSTSTNGKKAQKDSKSVLEKSAKDFQDNQIVQEEKSSAPAPAVDDWAVVEDKKKAKPKKSKAPEAPVQAASASSTTASTVAVAAPAPTDHTTSQVVVDAKKLGNIVGPKGVTLKALQELTSTQINMPKGDKDSSAANATVVVIGPAEGVAKATSAITDLCTKGYSLLLEADDFQESNITVNSL